MANRNKAVGTKNENDFVEILVSAGIPAHRAETNKKSHDIRIVGWTWPVECKKWARWRLFDWIRNIRSVAEDDHWFIFASHADRRTKEGREVGMVCVMDAHTGARAIKLLQEESNGH